MKNKTLKIHLGILTFIYFLFMLFITKNEFIYGSNVDFIRQHVTFPEYFRNLFYETGEFFPKFALHLGAGENIFYYAYYGFLSPITIFSYILPFTYMTDYLIISSIILNYISILLIYYILKKNQSSLNLSFIGSLLFMFSSSLMFHSHRHLMFVNYMPFLLLAFIGTNRYFEKKKNLLLIISCFLMILTSFYFSISGFLSISLYALYRYLKMNPNFSLKEIFIIALKFLLRIILSILLSSFFLLPTLYIILNGRNSTNFSLDILNFLPSTNLNNLMYGSYGVGLSGILWLSFIYQLIYGKKENKVISIFLCIITLIPIFNILLNGGLYSNGKCFIPLIPIYIILIVDTLKNADKITKPLFIFALLFSILLLKAKFTIILLFISDLIFSFLVLYFYQKKKKSFILTPCIVLAGIICFIFNNQDNLVSIKDYQVIKKINNYDYENYLDGENSLYRFMDYKSGSNSLNFSKALNDYRITSYSSTTNPYYTNVFYNTFNNNDIYRNKFMFNETNNLFFQKFMGVKYILTDKNPGYGYTKINEYDESTLYKNDNVYPIGFSSSHLLNKNEYQNLSWINKLEALLNNIIIDGISSNANTDFQSKNMDLKYKIIESKNITYQKNDYNYLIESKNDGKLLLELNEPIINYTLIIRFKLNRIPSCKEGDIAVTINDVTNKLTCKTWKYYNENETFDFVLSSNDEIKNLNITFTKGIYDISDIETYKMPNSFFDSNHDLNILTNIKTYHNGNIIEGKINNKNNGYFIFTIPYDKGFRILVDDIETEYTLINEAFIGFKLEKGIHKIELKFEPPWLNLGINISIFAGISIIFLEFIERKKD